VNTGKREQSDAGCLTEGDLAALVRPSALRGRHYLRASESGAGPIRLLTGEVVTEGNGPPPPNRPLLPWLKGPEARLSRFDPVWLTDHTVAYLERP
jgi:hypothetical protein